MIDPAEALADRLEAERLQPSRDERFANPLRDLIAALDRLLTNPGPPDPVPTPDSEETTNHG